MEEDDFNRRHQELYALDEELARLQSDRRMMIEDAIKWGNAIDADTLQAIERAIRSITNKMADYLGPELLH